MYGQETWSLQKCIKYALENNIKLKQQELVVDQSRNNLIQSKMNLTPGLSGSLSHNMNWGRSVNMQDLEIIENKLSQSTGLSLRSSVAISEGLTKQNQIKNSDLVYKISKLDVEKVKNDISVEIARTFLQVVLSQEILKNTLESSESVKGQVERSKKLVDAGAQAYGTLLEIEAQAATERVQVVNAINQVKSNLLNLKQLLDLPESSIFEVDIPKIELSLNEYNAESASAIYDLAVSNLPQIKSAILNVESSDIKLKIAKGQYYPSLNLSAGFGSNWTDSRNDAFFQQIKDNRNPSLSFSLSIPIFSSYNIKTSVDNAKIGVENAKLNLKYSRQLLFKEIQQANLDAGAAWEKLKASEENVKSIEEAFRYVLEKFNLGILNATDFTIARTNLTKAKSEYLQSKYQFVFQLKILDFYKGKEITL